MKESVAICIVTNNLYFETRYAIENLIAKTKYKFKLYIYENNSSDDRIKSFLVELIEKKKGHIILSESTVKKSKAINELLNIISEKYCVIFPINCLVHQNWLEDLIFNFNTIHNPGLIGIRNESNDLHLTPILHHSPKKYEDKLKNVFVSDTNAIEGLFLFDKIICNEKVGLFNENFKHEGCEELEFSFRFSAQGFNNIYIRKQTLIKLNLQNDILFIKKTKDSFSELKEEVKNIIKTQNFKK